MKKGIIVLFIISTFFPCIANATLGNANHKISSNISSSEYYAIRCGVVQHHYANNTFKTGYEIYMWPDFNTVIDSITIQGPDGVNLPYTKDDFTQFIDDYRDYFLIIDGVPSTGTYTFKVTSGTITVTAQDTQTVNRVIPNPEIVSPAANSIITSTTPVFHWNSISYPGTNIYYRIVIEDIVTYHRVASTPRTLGMLSYEVPANVLKSGQTYRFHIRAGDSSDSIDEQNQGRSEWRTFTMGTTIQSCIATLDGYLSLHIPVLSYLIPYWGAPSYWADLVYEYNPAYPASILFKLINVGVISDPTFSCTASTLSDDLKIHIPDILLPDGIAHIWVDLEYSPALSTDENAYFLVTGYGVVSNR